MVFSIERDVTLSINGDEGDYTVRADVDFSRDGVEMTGTIEVCVDDAWVRLDTVAGDAAMQTAEDAIVDHALEYGPPVDDDDSAWRESRCGW